MSASMSISRVDRRLPKAIEKRLLDRVVRMANGCWEWQGARAGAGYGKMYANRKARDTHRISYEIFCAPIPPGMFVCHTCDNPPCVNPTHLSLGTAKDNNDQMRDRGRRVNLKGSESAVSKIAENDVVLIRKLFAEGVRRSEIASKFNLDATTITHIVRGRSWKHVAGTVASRTLPPKLSGDDIAQARVMREEGKSFSQIGRHFGVVSETVRRTLIRAAKRV